MALSKPSKEYQAYWDAHPVCEACQIRLSGPPNHINTRGAFGSDDPDNLLALCHGDHYEIWHTGGPVKFMEMYPHLAEKILAKKPKLEFAV